MLSKKTKGFTPTPNFGVSLPGKRGFTLVELLVVIAIIGLLASIVLVSLNTVRQKARDAKRLGDWRQVALALELYYDNNNNAYPTVVGCTVANWQGTMTVCLEGTGAAPCNVSYMTKVPVDPRNTSPYFYYYASNGTAYVLRGQLEQNTTPGAPDIEGTVLGCACDDPIYCIRP